jgi:hypothetical protein
MVTSTVEDDRMRKSLLPPTGIQLSESLLNRLNLYALGATAAGVGMLACAQTVEAKIVYTPAHVSITGGMIPLDLNHDGKADFYFQTSTNATSFAGSKNLAITRYYGPASNAVVAPGRRAIALKAGERIGPLRKFQARANLATVVRHSQSGNTTFKWYGQWGNHGKGLKNRYLGLRFVINGQLHFGWARVSVFIYGRDFSPPPLLTGYAYETVPQKPIVAGETKGGDEASVEASSVALPIPGSRPATLGLLAMGARGVNIWRREDTGDGFQDAT